MVPFPAMNAVSTAVLEPLDSKVERFATMMLVVGGLGLLAAIGSAVLWPIFRMEQPVVASVALLAAFFFADLTHGWVLAYVVLLRKSFDAPRLGGAVAGPAVSAVLACFAPLGAIKAVQFAHGGLIEDWKVWATLGVTIALQAWALSTSRRLVRSVEAALPRG